MSHKGHAKGGLKGAGPVVTGAKFKNSARTSPGKGLGRR